MNAGGEGRQVLFVVGMPRSGTKLLRDLLNRHDDIAIFPNESHFMPFLPGMIERCGDPRDPRAFAELYDALATTKFFRRIGGSGLSVECGEWHRRVRGPAARDVLAALFEWYAETTGSRVVGDKTPEYLVHVPTLAAFFPAAKFVHIIRDPRDYAVSIRKAWGKSAPRAVQRWKSWIRRCRQDTADCDADVATVRYEDLLSEPRQALERLCTFIGVSFQEAMLSLERPAENLGDTRGEAAIVSGNFGKWQHELSDDEVRRIERIAGRLMAELGYTARYELGDEDVPGWRMALHRARDGVNLARFGFRHGGIAGMLDEVLTPGRGTSVHKR